MWWAMTQTFTNNAWKAKFLQDAADNNHYLFLEHDAQWDHNRSKHWESVRLKRFHTWTNLNIVLILFFAESIILVQYFKIK
jgi:hypothetical protein